MKIEIRDIDSDSGNLETFIVPENGFVTVVELELGISGKIGQDLFRFTLCDYQGFQNFLLPDLKSQEIASLNDYNIFLIEEFDYQSLLKKLYSIFEEATNESNDWVTTAKKLNKYFYWEYQNSL